MAFRFYEGDRQVRTIVWRVLFAPSHHSNHRSDFQNAMRCRARRTIPDSEPSAAGVLSFANPFDSQLETVTARYLSVLKRVQDRRKIWTEQPRCSCPSSSRRYA